VDRSQHTYPSLDELRQIRSEARKSNSLDDLRHYYERVQGLRRAHAEDFDLQLFIAEVQDEIIERARAIREQPAEERASIFFEENPPPRLVRGHARPAELSEAAEISPETPRVDSKTWQRATYLALFLTLIICAAFFYLIQTARRINLPSAETPSQQTPQAGAEKNVPAQPASNPTPTAPANPTLRLYTDLAPGTVSVDEGEPQDLKDGELVLDKLQPGRHSIKVSGRGGVAAFSFDVAEKSAPRVVGLPTVSNAMAVLVSAEDGRGRLITNAQNAQVILDGKAVGEVGTDGLALDSLGKIDHDLQVARDKDRQRFVLTYTPAPALTVYVKSDPNAGTVVVITGQDGVEVYINDLLYRRRTDRGQVRIPLKVGEYTIRAHKAGFIDPPPADVVVKKAEEAPVEFRMQAVPEIATLQIKGALPGTMVYVDKDVAAVIAADGNANISNVKPGEHTIELRRDQALPKRFQRAFHTGDVVVLSGPDVTLEKVVAENTPAPPSEASLSTKNAAPNYSMEMEGSQVRKGGGFVPYHVPKVAGHYTFAAQGHLGGFLKKSKLQWYAGYQDSENYVLFAVDGKHATIREVRDGKSVEVSKIPFNVDSNQWVQTDLSVKPNSITARVKTPEGAWNDLGSVTSAGRDFTQDKVGFYIPGNDEVSVSNFRFSNH
jgi:hypothetical protein